MRRVLVPIDDSKCSQKAAEYAAEQYAGVGDLEIGLVHVMPGVPALFWDDGHILGAAEEQERRTWVDGWLTRHRQRMTPVLQSVAEFLVKRGFAPGRITTRFVDDGEDVADALLAEAKRGGYRTILMGRCGIAEGRHLLIGSVTSRLIHHGTGIAICIVE